MASSGEEVDGAMARTGRRPGNSGTREAILDAARRAFAERGYQQATIREVAGLAGVDPALVHHYFGTKQDLFVAAVEIPVNPFEAFVALVSEEGLETLGERLLGLFLSVWDQTEQHSPMLALIRSAVSEERAAAMLREFITEEILGRIARELGTPDARLRTNLVASQLVGLIMARYVIRIEPLASTPAPVLVAAIGPTLQRYITGDIGAASPAAGGSR
jgi:AcrR family transcriptional regulator